MESKCAYSNQIVKKCIMHAFRAALYPNFRENLISMKTKVYFNLHTFTSKMADISGLYDCHSTSMILQNIKFLFFSSLCIYHAHLVFFLKKSAAHHCNLIGEEDTVRWITGTVKKFRNYFWGEGEREEGGKERKNVKDRRGIEYRLAP